MDCYIFIKNKINTKYKYFGKNHELIFICIIILVTVSILIIKYDVIDFLLEQIFF